MTAEVASPAFALVAACCRWPHDDRRAAAIGSAAACCTAVHGTAAHGTPGHGASWDAALHLARRHRVELLVADGLRRTGIVLPPPAARALRAAAARALPRNMVHAATSLALSRMLAAHGIDHVFFKGETLAMAAYGTLSVKSANDIDLLVWPADFISVCALLTEAGYRRIFPAPQFPAHELPLYRRQIKDHAFRHPETDVLVELHHRLCNNPCFMAAIGMASARQEIAVSRGHMLPTFAAAELLVYLCGHGAIQGWHRLKWLADVAALLARMEPRALDDAMALARRQRMVRPMAQALLLCAALFETPLPTALHTELVAVPHAATLQRSALRTLHSWHNPVSSRRNAFREARDWLLIEKRPTFLGHMVRGMWYNMMDRQRLALPPGFGALYHILRVPMAAYRILAPRIVRRRRPAPGAAAP